MTFRLGEMSAVSAFIVTTLTMVGVISLILLALGMSNAPHLSGHLAVAWFPVLLSFGMYMLLARNAASSKRRLYLGACITALIAPIIAGQMYFFFGFAFLGWQM